MPFVPRQPIWPPDEVPSFRSQLPGMIFMLVVTLGAQHLAFELQDEVQAGLGLTGATIGKDPPWYFIHRDFAKGVSSGIALLPAWTLALVFWKRFRIYSAMCVWMPWIWLGGPVSQALIIYRECPGLLLDGSAATISWQTFDSYLEDPDIDFFKSAVLWSAVFMSFVFSWLDWLWRKKQVSQMREQVTALSAPTGDH